MCVLYMNNNNNNINFFFVFIYRIETIFLKYCYCRHHVVIVITSATVGAAKIIRRHGCALQRWKSKTD